MTDAKTLVELEKLAPEKPYWKPCPTCREMRPEADPITWDWMNLRPCHFFEGDRKMLAEVCVDCAESVQLLPWLADKYPIPSCTVDIDDRKTYANGGQYLRPCGFVESSGMKFMVTSSGNYKIHVRRMGVSEPLKEYDNTFQAWMAIRANIQNGDPVTPTDGWGERPAVKPRRERKDFL